MSTYTNVSSTIITPIKLHIDENWVGDPNSNFLYREVLSRGGYLLLTAACMITVAIDTIIGLGSAILSVATLGMSRSINEFTFHHLESTENALTYTFRGLLRTMNPHAIVPDSGELSGFLTDPLFKKQAELFFKFRDSNSFLTKHLASRVTFAINPFILIIGRVADMALSAVAVPFAFATFGMIGEINGIADQSLQFPAIICDFVTATIFFINPFAPLEL